MRKQSTTTTKIRAMLGAGKTVKEIAAKLKIKPTAVYQVRHKMAKEENAAIAEDVKANEGPVEKYTPHGIYQDLRFLDPPGVVVGQKAVHEVLATPVFDPVNHPVHYTTGKIETIDYIDAKGFNYCLGNAIKYVSRAPHKSKYVEDLKKAIWYIDHAIKLHEEGRG